MNLVCLIGEQPIPNLLPILHFHNNGVLEQVLLVHTKNEGSRKAGLRLKQLCTRKQINADLLDIGDAYRLGSIFDKFKEKISGRPEAEWTFNLTGGTKLMSLAAAQLAADLKHPCVYYQTEFERGQYLGRLLRFQFDEKGRLIEKPEGGEVLPILLTLEDYLLAHLDGYQEEPLDKSKIGWKLEEAVYKTLKPHVDEILRGIKPEGVRNQLEMDLLIRIGNQVGVVEVKTGGEGSGKSAVDQLTTAAAREYLGTYAVRFLVTQQAREDRYKALASALRVHVIDLTNYRGETILSPVDQSKLLETVRSKMPKLAQNRQD